MNLWNKILSVALAGTMALSVVTPAFAAEQSPEEKLYQTAVSKYEAGTGEFVKISHPQFSSSTFQAPQADGIVDYLGVKDGKGQIGIPSIDAAENLGDRGMSYSWGSAAYGDWMYICTQYSSMMSTLDYQYGKKSEQIKQQIRLLFNDHLFIEEKDKGVPGSALIKINVKTGEVKKLLSWDMSEKAPKNYNFRNGLKFHDKLYFCGSPGGIPSVYEIDPEHNDAVQIVYQENIPSWEEVLRKNLAPAIRGMSVFQDHLVISSVGADANPRILISSDPSAGKESFHEIASTWENAENTKPGELLGYAACHQDDSIMGGGIWEMAEFNDKLYVAICTGTPANAVTKTNALGQKKIKNMQSFAIVCGECKGDPTVPENWAWTPVIGDQKEDGAKYTFGIDPERTRAGACTMRVYGEHLYIGEYNDAEIAIFNMLGKMDFEFLADNLQQSVNLYRMDKSHNIELLVGDATKQFPDGGSLGLRSGFGKRGVRHENQYIWQMNVYDGKLYLGTHDQTTLLYPVAKFVNGDVFEMTPEQWQQQIELIVALLEEIFGQKQEQVSEPGLMDSGSIPAEMQEKIAAAAAAATEADKQALQGLAEAQKQTEAFLQESAAFNILDLPATMSAEDEITSLEEFYSMALMMPRLMEQDPTWTVEEAAAAKQQLIKIYDSMYRYFTGPSFLPPDFIQDIIRELLQEILETVMKEVVQERLLQLGRCITYLTGSVSGCDVFSFDGKTLQEISRDGMGDPFNHGIRAIGVNNDPENTWMCMGTANPCYGTQVWRLYNNEDIPTPAPDPDPDPSPDPVPEPEYQHPGYSKPAAQKRIIILTIDDCTVMVDGIAFENDVAAIIRNDRTFTPARVVAEKLGAVVSWNGETRQVTIEGNGTTIILTIGSKTALVNGREAAMDVAPFIEKDRTYTPARFIAENLGAEVTWDAVNRQVIIEK